MNGVVQVFEADSGEFVIAFLGTMGCDGLLIWRGERGWEFHEAQSVAWDAQHQGAFRNSRAAPIAAAALKARGIPWPDPTAYRGAARQWKDNFASEVPFSAVHESVHMSAHGSVLGKLAGGSALPVHLILYEDLYETAFGDGKFLYPHAAFWSEAKAQELARQTPPDRHAYPVRICAHQSGERLVAYQHQEGLALHNVVALLAMDSAMK
jgi:hypothetical protein